MCSFNCASARPSRGFTLIELLIVIAIISILAMIAVPNFLEAQTRSKNARCMADMRTLKTALEAYYVDYNQYPIDYDDISGLPYLNDMASWRQLTTPIAFITSVMYMPYKFIDTQSGGYRFRPNTVYSYFGPSPSKPVRFVSTYGTNPVPIDGSGVYYVVQSPGPDQVQDFGVNFKEEDIVPLNQRKTTNNIDGINTIYDPTNGTVSKGDILMTGKGFCY
ncbi:MAG: type II secretion system protein [Candidatus Sumerlaeota bacterium]|nr:type II secretion system protein [Candidatus Sumerlaeota bacterium]